MSGSVNKVILVGNVGKDPEVKTFQNGGKIVEFSIATSERWNDKQSGEKKEKTEWHRVVVSGENLARVAENYIRKGSKVCVEGKLQTREWQDQAGRNALQLRSPLVPSKVKSRYWIAALLANRSRIARVEAPHMAVATQAVAAIITAAAQVQPPAKAKAKSAPSRRTLRMIFHFDGFMVRAMI